MEERSPFHKMLKVLSMARWPTGTPPHPFPSFPSFPLLQLITPTPSHPISFSTQDYYVRVMVNALLDELANQENKHPDTVSMLEQVVFALIPLNFIAFHTTTKFTGVQDM
eukprot:TRINITY_DN5251_c0_g1_i6.p2 TRINITY_DN5251_c0_g1~~TRINITY_DN5251_c0_g1_i6.p2  ORF type:complete len:110 (-),score=20.05 TRINITY_DN5251_c0_g1_i6:93-422(-)